MKAYLDSSATVKLYVREAWSAEISRYVRTLDPPLPFSHLHELEIRNGLRLKVSRREAPAAALRTALELLDSDMAAGILARPELHWLDVFRQAGELSDSHSLRLGSRSLDLLHVASALLLDAGTFVTFDDRQRALAGAAGLAVPDPTRLT